MKIMNYTQSTPSTAWTIAHNFGGKVVADTTVTVNGVPNKIIPLRVTNVDDNTLLIEFSSPYTGSSRVVGS
jgi:hypothetical protein